jgi:hypothetical protein
MSRPQPPRTSVIHKRRRKRQSPSPECLRKRRRDPASPELCQNIRLRSRVMCLRDPSQCPIRKAVSPQHGLRQICQPLPLRPLHLDRQSLVGWPRFPSDRTLRESAGPTSLPAPRNWLRQVCYATSQCSSRNAVSIQQRRLQEVLFPRAFRATEKQFIEHKQPVYFSAC